jgi:hypothetical protein
VSVNVSPSPSFGDGLRVTQVLNQGSAAAQIDAEQSLRNREMVVVGDFRKRVAFGIDEIPTTTASDLGTPFTERASIVKRLVLARETAIRREIGVAPVKPDQGSVVSKRKRFIVTGLWRKIYLGFTLQTARKHEE